MKILAIDTSCDETSVAVTSKTTVLANVLWSQASIHSQFGGVFPSLAKRAHEERIDWVVATALSKANTDPSILDAIAVTSGPGLAIALEVGIKKAKELAVNYKRPLIVVNHVEGHLLSILAQPKPKIKRGDRVHVASTRFPTLALIASGKHTDIVLVKGIGDYEILASTVDDALGEALDKAARMLGLGYPGGPVLEKMAKLGTEKYLLPVPMLGKEERFTFSYSGLKTAMWKLVESEKPLTKQKIYDLSYVFQNASFKHVENLLNKALQRHQVNQLWFGGGVSANTELRKRLRKICKKHSIPLLIPYSKKLCTDNAAMIGVAAHLHHKTILRTKSQIAKLEREPRLRL